MPEDLRVAYRILKNGGFVPAEVETLNQIAQLEVKRAASPLHLSRFGTSFLCNS